MTRLVIIESRYAPNPVLSVVNQNDQLATHIRYLRACLHDSLMRGEAPYASHGLYTQEGVLDDKLPEEREHGIQAGFAWRQVAHLTAVYTDFGISSGMEYSIEDAKKRGVPVEYRTLPTETFRKVKGL